MESGTISRSRMTVFNNDELGRVIYIYKYEWITHRGDGKPHKSLFFIPMIYHILHPWLYLLKGYDFYFWSHSNKDQQQFCQVFKRSNVMTHTNKKACGQINWESPLSVLLPFANTDLFLKLFLCERLYMPAVTIVVVFINFQLLLAFLG